LVPYFNANPDDELVATVQHTLSTDGALFRIAPAFMIMTLLGNSDFVGTGMGWTFNEMTALTDEMGASAFPVDWNRENALQFLILQNIGEYVDWDSGEVRFDSSDFKTMLEAVKTFPAADGRHEDNVARVNTGEQLTLQKTIVSHLDYARLDAQLGGKSVAKGFPGENRTAGVLLPTPFTLAMTAACRDKDGAWRFIETALKTDVDGFASLKAKFNEQSNLATSAEYAAEQSAYIEYSAISGEQLQRLEAILVQTDTLAGGNRTISTIISEEAAPYFSGQKSLEDIAKIIQSRASLYVNEQR
jgi:ABC-type glycerol-3-phosphate transport system substrate-binding protein